MTPPTPTPPQPPSNPPPRPSQRPSPPEPPPSSSSGSSSPPETPSSRSGSSSAPPSSPGAGDPRLGWQRRLEEQLLAELAQPVALSFSVAERFGEPERWQVEAWGLTFLLLPLNGAWVVLDTAHDDWKPTGLRAGQGAFVWGDHGPEVVHQPTGTAEQRAVLEAHRSRVLEQLEEAAR